MYWTEWGDGAAIGKVSRANLDGTDEEELIMIPNGLLKGMALDLVQGKMYWTDCTFSKIQRANLDGSLVEDLVAPTIGTPNALDLDHLNGKIYWTDFSFGKIRRANLDGSNIQDVLTSDLDAPQDIVLNIKDLEPTSPVGERHWEWGFYPNPAHDFLTIQGMTPGSDAAIFDQKGQMLWTQKDWLLDVSGLAAGIHEVKIREAEGQVFYLRFIKI